MYLAAIEECSVDVPGGYGKRTGKFLRFDPHDWICIEIEGRTAEALFDKIKKEGKAPVPLVGRNTREESARDFLSLWGENPSQPN